MNGLDDFYRDLTTALTNEFSEGDGAAAGAGSADANGGNAATAAAGSPIVNGQVVGNGIGSGKRTAGKAARTKRRKGERFLTSRDNKNQPFR